MEGESQGKSGFLTRYLKIKFCHSSYSPLCFQSLPNALPRGYGNFAEVKEKSKKSKGKWR